MVYIIVKSYSKNHTVEVMRDNRIIDWCDCFDREALDLVMEVFKKEYHPSEITRIIK